MNVRIGISNRLLILVMALACQPSIHAQIPFALPENGSGGSGSTAVILQFRLDGSIVEEGSGLSTLSDADLQAASRFIWYPAQSALRAGGGLSTESVSDVGPYSVAFGYQTRAAGWGSIAIGKNSIATLDNSMAMGASVTASAANTVALNVSTTASGYASIAMGDSTVASGQASVSMGGASVAGGFCSTSTGLASYAFGFASFSAGELTDANSLLSFVMGTYNIGLSETGATPNLTTWVSTDPIFEIGNGTAWSATSDALVVYKDGNAKLQGTLTTAPGGDIPMYTGN
jgi:hypothetical protein